MNKFYIFIPFALTAIHVNSMSKWTTLRKAATANYHTCAKDLDVVQSASLQFESLKNKYLLEADEKIKKLLNEACTKKVHPDRLDPMNDANIKRIAAIPSKISAYIPFTYESIVRLRLGKPNEKIGPITSNLIYEQLKTCGINPTNIAIDTTTRGDFEASVFTIPHDPTKQFLTVNTTNISDKVIHRVLRFEEDIFIPAPYFTKHVIAHEACHILKRDNIAHMLNAYHSLGSKTCREFASLFESRADLYSVFYGPTPLLFALACQDWGTDHPYYAHRKSPQWKKLIEDLQTIGLNKDSKQVRANCEIQK